MVRCLESILIGRIRSNDEEKNECVVSTADDETILYKKRNKKTRYFPPQNYFSYSYVYIYCQYLLINTLDNLTSFINIYIYSSLYVPY
jgi:hypothetical protein